MDDGSTDNEHRLGAVKDIQVALEAIKGRSGESFLVIAGDYEESGMIWKNLRNKARQLSPTDMIVVWTM